MSKTRKLVNWGSINKLQHPFTLWHVPVILTGIGISSLDIKLPSIWIHKKQDKILYIEWLVTGGTNEKGVILREKRSRKYRRKIFRLRLYFRENRLWIFDRYACNACNILEGFINITSIETQSTIKSVITKRDKVHAYASVSYQLPTTLYIQQLTFSL